MALPGILTGEAAAASGMDPAQLATYNNIQRAYIQSAVHQNMQIQQHLLAQNQALQQLLNQGLPVRELLKKL